jgi:hypothetical protein
MPAIVYKVLDDSTLQENIYEMIIQYDCISDLYDTSKNIRDRVQEILDVGNSISNDIPYGYYLYYNSTIENYFNYKEPNLDIFHNIISFKVQYNDIYGFLLQENSFYLLQENGFNFRSV